MKAERKKTPSGFVITGGALHVTPDVECRCDYAWSAVFTPHIVLPGTGTVARFLRSRDAQTIVRRMQRLAASLDGSLVEDQPDARLLVAAARTVRVESLRARFRLAQSAPVTPAAKTNAENTAPPPLLAAVSGQ